MDGFKSTTHLSRLFLIFKNLLLFWINRVFLVCIFILFFSYTTLPFLCPPLFVQLSYTLLLHIIDFTVLWFSKEQSVIFFKILNVWKENNVFYLPTYLTFWELFILLCRCKFPNRIISIHLEEIPFPFLMIFMMLVTNCFFFFYLKVYFFAFIFEDYPPLIQNSVLKFLPFSKVKMLFSCFLASTSSVKSAAIFHSFQGPILSWLFYIHHWISVELPA